MTESKMEDEHKNRRRLMIAAPLLFSLIALAAYRPYLSAPFLHDDLHTIRDNPALTASAGPVYFFQHPESASAFPSTMVRPLLTWTYALNYQLFGPRPFSFHLVNLGLHVLNACLVVLVTRETRTLKTAALPAGLLFLLLPINSILIGYASCRSTLLSATFYLGALLVFVRAFQRPVPAGRLNHSLSLAGIVLLFMAGLFVKSVAATLPAAVLAWAFCFRRGPENDRAQARARLRWTMTASLGLFAALGLYFVYRHLHQAPSFFPAARPWPVWQYLAAQPLVFFTYLKLIALPVGFSLEHETWMPAEARSLFHPAFIFPVLGLALMSGLALFRSRRAPELSFAALFSIIYLLPTASVIPLVMVVNENRPYLSALLWVWVLALAYQRAAEKRPAGSGVCLSLILVLFASLLVLRAGSYQSEEAIWRDAVKKAPGTARSHINLGLALKSYGRHDLAELRFKKALELEPCNAPALNNLANLHDLGRDRGRAEAYYRRALDCDPNSIAALVNLADLLAGGGRHQEARQLLERARALQPHHPELIKRLPPK